MGARQPDRDVDVNVVDVTAGTPPPAGPEVVSLTPSNRRPVWIALAVVAAVLVALAGFTLGRSGRDASAGRSGPPTVRLRSTSTDFRPNGLLSTVGRCSAQRGTTLQLGVRLFNNSDRDLTLSQPEIAVPLPGLRPKSVQDGTCGEIDTAEPLYALTLHPSDTVWVVMSVTVTVPCPGALPVELSFMTNWNDGQARVAVFAFPDLGDVPYSGCAGS